MSEDATVRLAELLKEGRELVDELDGEDDSSWVDFGEVARHEAWLGEIGQLLLATEGPQADSFRRYKEILNSQRNPAGVKIFVLRRVFDLTVSVFEKWSCGSLRRFEDTVAAPLLDDLLDHAESYLGNERVTEAAAVARAVFEYTLKRIAARGDASSPPPEHASCVAICNDIAAAHRSRIDHERVSRLIRGARGLVAGLS